MKKNEVSEPVLLCYDKIVSPASDNLNWVNILENLTKFLLFCRASSKNLHTVALKALLEKKMKYWPKMSEVK